MRAPQGFSNCAGRDAHMQRAPDDRARGRSRRVPCGKPQQPCVLHPARLQALSETVVVDVEGEVFGCMAEELQAGHALNSLIGDTSQRRRTPCGCPEGIAQAFEHHFVVWSAKLLIHFGRLVLWLHCTFRRLPSIVRIIPLPAGGRRYGTQPHHLGAHVACLCPVSFWSKARRNLVTSTS